MERNCLFSELKIQQEKVEKFQSHLQSIYQLLKLEAKVSEIDIESVRCSTFLTSENVNNCSTERRINSHF